MKTVITLSDEELKEKITGFFKNAPADALFPLTVTGHSMTPFLVQSRDTAYLSAADKVYIGDIVLYQRKNGKLILHRIIARDGDNIITAGDCQDVTEVIKPESLIAVCRKVMRKGRIVTEKDMLWRFFSVAWIKLVGERKKLMTVYEKLWR